MKPERFRTSVDLPRPLHRKLHEAAARKGCSARQLILTAIEQAIQPPPRKKAGLNLEHGLVPRTGNRSQSPNEESMSLVFPDIKCWLALQAKITFTTQCVWRWQKEVLQSHSAVLRSWASCVCGRPRVMNGNRSHEARWKVYDGLMTDER